jgi:hypothetical protein
MIMEHTLAPLAAWESFYVIIGSAAAALTGLQFVVIVLGAEMKMLGGGLVMRAFGTPTIVHFSAVLLVSAILSVPWQTLSSPGLFLSACGVIGIAYVLLVLRHTRRQTDYTPVAEDWLSHCALPLLAYTTLLVAGITLRRHPSSLFVIGATALLLLFVGIHNAWDAVMYLAIERGPKVDQNGDQT